MSAHPEPSSVGNTDVHDTHTLPLKVDGATTPSLPPADDPYATRATETPFVPPPAAALQGWPTVPSYEILGELGRGGMGIVYKAVQTDLKRVVALKLILAGPHASGEAVARFRAEAEAVARLQHPHIVQVFEVGEHNGLPFFSLEFCPGGSLDQKLKGTPLLPKEAARLIETLAHAMHAAHRQHVIHRDLKPANILLATDEHGSTRIKTEQEPAKQASPTASASIRVDPRSSVAAFLPKVTDFGLARQLDVQGPTLSGAVMGTPQYMAPEQAGGKTKEIGPACDVYALGAILYELLTGRPPFTAATTLDTVLQVLSDDPVPPSRLQRGTPRDLETICLKCLQKDPRKRYVSAADLAEDLRRFLAGEPVRARRVGTAERAVKWVRRRPTVAGLLAMLVVLMATAAGLMAWQYGQVVTQRDNYLKQKQFTERSLAASKIQLADATLRDPSTPIGITLAYLDEVPGEQRFWEWHYLKRKARGGLYTLYGHSGGRVAFSPDGQWLASGSEDQTVKVWDTRTGQEVRTLQGHTRSVTSVAYSPDGKQLASCSEDQTVKVWDARTGQELLSLKEQSGPVVSVAFSPDSKWLASGDQHGTVKLWDATPLPAMP